MRETIPTKISAATSSKGGLHSTTAAARTATDPAQAVTSASQGTSVSDQVVETSTRDVAAAV